MARRTVCAEWFPTLAAAAALAWASSPAAADRPRFLRAAPPPRVLEVDGTITAVLNGGGTGGGVTITTARGAAVTVTVDANTAIKVDGANRQTIANLATGMRAEVHYKAVGGANPAVRIEAKTPIYPVAGTISSVVPAMGMTPGNVTITPLRGKPVTLTVDANTTISVDRNSGQTIGSLVAGMKVAAVYKVAGTSNVAIRIEAISIAFVEGTITAVNAMANTVDVTKADKTTVILTVDTRTAITVDRAKGQTIANLAPNMQVDAVYRLTSTGNIALKIEATDTAFVKGIISAVSTTASTVDITRSDKTTVTVTVNASTAISVDGVASKMIGDLLVGMKAQAAYKLSGTPSNLALRIDAGDTLYVKGTITTVTSPNGLTITRFDGTTVTVTTDANTAITINRVAGQMFDSLVAGMRVEVKYQVTATGNLALKIEATDLVCIEGTISAVNAMAGTVDVTKADKTTVTVTVNASTVITLEDAGRKTIADLLVGMKADVAYRATSTGNVALRIEADDTFQVKGTISAVDAMANTVTITRSDMTTLTVTVGANTNIKIDRAARQTIANLAIGMRAEVKYRLTSMGNLALKIEASRP
jgi:hypothetical protein